MRILKDGYSMDLIDRQVEKLRSNLVSMFGVWIRGKQFVGRTNSRGKVIKPAELVTTVTLTRAATKFLAKDHPICEVVTEACEAKLKNVNSRGFPWGPKSEDGLAGPYIAGRVLCDLGPFVDDLVSKQVIKRAEKNLEQWLSSENVWRHAINLPFIYRGAKALKNRSVLDSQLEAKIGRHAQSYVDYYVSRHCLGSRSHFDPMLVCLGIITDAEFSPNPLSRAERTRCVEIALNEYEPLITLSRSTTTRGGVGCSSIEVSARLLQTKPAYDALEVQIKHLSETFSWLNDHSSLVTINDGSQVRLFQTDLWSSYPTYDAWFNALVIELFEETTEFVAQSRHRELQNQYSAVKPKAKVKYRELICGGFNWPNLLHERLLQPIVKFGATTNETGNGIVLFGPPGTGKTTVAQIIASELPDWQFVRLTTADFLAEGYDNLFKTIVRIFSDLKWLRRCVVLFDELELLVLERDGQKADWSTGVLTNVMLPELQSLHDLRHIIPIFATNHISKLDKAGRRPGRFDFVLPVGLPSKEERRNLIKPLIPSSHMFKGIETIPEGGTIREILDWAREYRNSPEIGYQAAMKIWQRGFKLLRIDAATIHAFENDVENFTYPFDAQ